MQQRRKKRSELPEETKPKDSKYGVKKRNGCEVNHDRHFTSVPHCDLCQAIENMERRSS